MMAPITRARPLKPVAACASRNHSRTSCVSFFRLMIIFASCVLLILSKCTQNEIKSTLFFVSGASMVNISIALDALLVHNADMLNAEDIKTWLKEIGKDRAWLAEKTLVSKRTVDNWLSAGKPIVPQKMELIEKLMSGEEEIEFELPPDFEKQLRAMADEAKKTIEDMVSHILQVTAKAHQKRKAEAPSQQFTPVETFTTPPLEAQGRIIGNIAAGNLADGDTIPQDIRLYRELEKGEYLLRVNGHSMEPSIPDGSVVIMKKYTIPPIPKPGTIVQYHDERGVTLKKLVRRKNPETGKMEYTLHPINPNFGDIEPMDGGKISGIYVETLDRWEKA
nr:MAG TPA: peptidase [Caudoviricetes sp.]